MCLLVTLTGRVEITWHQEGSLILGAVRQRVSGPAEKLPQRRLRVGASQQASQHQRRHVPRAARLPQERPTHAADSEDDRSAR